MDDPYWDPYWATELRGDQIDYPNSLPANILLDLTYRIRYEKLKAMTEHYAYQVADERNKSYVLIIGSFHESKTTTRRGQKTTKPDGCHFTVNLEPGEESVHVYYNLHVPDNRQYEWVGQSVVPALKQGETHRRIDPLQCKGRWVFDGQHMVDPYALASGSRH
ncbi:hypothetical protein PENARI_c003G03360 [Penicillium arizonense]|uniref:Uncharacterized protein n=1 Tax=Penicillium arizonense TaxID=1835702 RepID=A0A1F5LSF7_PENAI|nr:hypothetical protein PENARI_c003G03360 [Penicillium arizonense]OGE56144.1 hypothetical protein PENARI_c003G03360 [Penicillium arizonense]